MIRGFYAAAAGVLTSQKAFNVISNNIGNTATAGFKAQSTVESSFREHMVSRVSSAPGLSGKNIGPGAFMTVNVDQYTDFTQGSLEGTNRNLDLAINGNGFFLVESEKYGQVATRNGQFQLNEEGELILPGVGKVLNEGKSPISLEGSDFGVDSQGTIYQNESEVDKLFITYFEGEDNLERVGPDMYRIDGGYRNLEPGNYAILQGVVEKSNTNLAQEMSKIIAEQSHYQNCTQILKIYDALNEKAVNQLGRVG